MEIKSLCGLALHAIFILNYIKLSQKNIWYKKYKRLANYMLNKLYRHVNVSISVFNLFLSLPLTYTCHICPSVFHPCLGSCLCFQGCLSNAVISIVLLLVSRILMNFVVLPVQIRTTIRIELLPPVAHLFPSKLYNYRFYFMVSAVLWLLIGIDVTMSSFNVLPFFISEIYGWVIFFSFLFEFFYGCIGLLLHRFMLVLNRFVVFVNL